MVSETAPHILQAVLLSGFAALSVFVLWIRHSWDSRLLFALLGLLLLGAAPALQLWAVTDSLPALCVTAALFCLHTSMRLHYGARPMLVLGSFILFSHLAILLISEPGYAPREASSFLIWAVFALATTAQLATPDDFNPLRRDPLLFCVFGVHALFCLGVASVYQLGLAEGSHLLGFIVLTEQVAFCASFAYALSMSVLRADLKRLHRELERSGAKPALIPVCSSCRKARDDKEAWHSLEEHLSSRTSLRFTHTVCPCCVAKLYPEISLEPLRQAAPRRAQRVSAPPFPFPSLEKKPSSGELVSAE